MAIVALIILCAACFIGGIGLTLSILLFALLRLIGQIEDS